MNVDPMNRPPAAPLGEGGATLSNAVIAFESEDAARRRLEAFGYPADVAAEIAVYLAQSTDLPLFTDEIAQALREKGIAAEFVALDDLPARLGELAPRRDRTIVWTLNDGVRFYRGSSVPALARLAGFARFGSPAAAAHLAQDKFASLALAAAAGLPVPPTRLMEGDKEIAALGELAGAAHSAVRQAQHARREDRHFRRQPVPRSAGGERPGAAHLGALSRPRARSSRSSKATTCA